MNRPTLELLDIPDRFLSGKEERPNRPHDREIRFTTVDAVAFASWMQTLPLMKKLQWIIGEEDAEWVEVSKVLEYKTLFPSGWVVRVWDLEDVE